MIKNISLLYDFLKNGECIKAKVFIDDIYNGFDMKKYAEAYIAVLLIETVKKMNCELYGFYEDAKRLQESLFEMTPYSRVDDAVRSICDNVRNTKSMNTEEAFNKAVEYIHNNFCNIQISAGLVADITGVSQSQLTELFKRKFDKGIAEYINHMRIKKSLAPLLEGKEKIGTIAENSGFITSEAYIRSFKRIYKVTPGRYRELMQQL